MVEAISDQNMLRILLVEDDPDDAYIVKDLLSWDPRRVYELTHLTSLEALASVSLSDFDVILLDLGLGNSQGLDTLRHVVGLSLDMPIVVLTGANAEQLGEQAIAAGAQDYLCKQRISEELLIRCIAYAIERFQMMQQTSGALLSHPVTKLPNINVLHDQINVLLKQNERQPIPMALCFLSITDLDMVSKQAGEPAKASVLQSVAHRLTHEVRASDHVCHADDDCFAYLLTNFQDRDTLVHLIEKKLSTLQAPIVLPKELSDEPLRLNWATGVAILRANMDVVQLHTEAQRCLEEAKNGRCNKLVVSPR